MRPRQSPFVRLLERVETFRNADTPVRVRKYNEARRAMLNYVYEVERRARAQSAMLTAIQEAMINPDEALPRIELFLRMAQRASLRPAPEETSDGPDLTDPN